MNTPLLLLLFNRPKETNFLFDKLKQIKPKKIYINQDGPRNKKDIDLCNQVRKIFHKRDWDCEIFENIKTKNLGCRNSVSEGINWFFQNEEKGIILEDDCLPSKSFFTFSEKMLKKYEYDNNIFLISGSNFQKNRIIGDGDYYFSKYAHCWGWSTWKRAWIKYDKNLNFWETWKKSKNWKNFHRNNFEKRYWTKIFNKVKDNKIDSWAYVWLASVWFNNGVTITPNCNLIQNIGFNVNATSTISSNKTYNIAKEEKMNSVIKDPANKSIDIQADELVFKNHFNGIYNFWPWRLIYIIKILIKDPRTFWLKFIKNLKW